MEKGKKYFSSFEIMERAGIKRPTFGDWIARGFIEPAVKAEGRGTKKTASIKTIFIRLSFFAIWWSVV